VLTLIAHFFLKKNFASQEADTRAASNRGVQDWRFPRGIQRTRRSRSRSFHQNLAWTAVRAARSSRAEGWGWGMGNVRCFGDGNRIWREKWCGKSGFEGLRDVASVCLHRAGSQILMVRERTCRS
jgi:hypothetical protein